MAFSDKRAQVVWAVLVRSPFTRRSIWVWRTVSGGAVANCRWTQAASWRSRSAKAPLTAWWVVAASWKGKPEEAEEEPASLGPGPSSGL